MKRALWIAGAALPALVALALLLWKPPPSPPPQSVPAAPNILIDRQAGPQAFNLIAVTGPPGRRAQGSSGDDKLMDRTGGAILIGLDGDDTYQAPDEKTRIVEGPGGGNDTIETWNNFRVPPQVENLVLVGKYSTGTAAPDGSRLTSKGLGNVLESGPGSDTMVAAPEARQTSFLVHPRSGADAILGFRARGDDHDFIRLTHAGLCDFGAIRRRLSASGGDDTRLTLGPRDYVLIKGVRPEELGPDHFLLCFSPAGMSLVFAEEFDRLSLLDRESGVGRWKTVYTHGPADGPGSAAARKLTGNKDEQIYVDPAYAGDPQHSTAPLGLNPFGIGDGLLTVRAWRLPPATSAKLWGHRFASGLLTSEASFAQTYGYFEIRAELPQQKGVFPAFWLLPSARLWPPEIDIMENVGQDFVTSGLVAPDQRRAFFIRFHAGVRGMHRYGVLWTRERISWVFDGQVVGSSPTPPSLHQDMYMLLNLAVGGKWPGSPAPSFREAAMKIDYIRAYRWTPPS